MINLLHLSKLKVVTISFALLVFNFNFTIAATPVDIWEKKENQGEQKTQISDEEKATIESPILSEDENNLIQLDKINKKIIGVDEQKINKFDNTVIGIFDPKDNNFNLNMWAESDGQDIKNIMKRINKLKLSKFSQNLLFKVLFTNAYPPKENLTSEEFLKIKIDWLIENKRLQDLETFLQVNSKVAQEPKTIKLLV